MSARPAKGTGATLGGALLADDAVMLMPLPPKMGAMLADGCHLT